MSTTAIHGPTAQAAGHFTSHEELVNHKEALESAASAEAAHQERDRLLSRMRGATVTIPDIQALMSHWPQGVNPEIERLERDSQDMLAWILNSPNDGPRLKKMNRSGVALFGASWWAYAPYEALLTATYLSIWLFVWDDETDSLEFASLINDFDAACAFRRETMAYIEASLQKERTVDLDSISTNRVITNFKPVGEAIAKNCNQRQINTFLEELRFFIQMSEEEQMFQMTPHLPTIEDYSRRRKGSSAVRVCLAITEYAFGITLPDEVMNDEDMEVIWNETNVNISTVNDILSIKKEVDQSQIDTLIPLLVVKLGSVQAAIDRATEITRESIERFEAAEKRLMEKYTDEKTQEDIRKFIDGAKYASTANLNWSLISGRYKLGLTSMAGGVVVTL